MFSQPRYQGELLGQPQQLAYSFDRDRLLLNLCVDHQSRSVSLKFALSDADPQRDMFDDAQRSRDRVERRTELARQVASELRSLCEGFCTRVLDFVGGRPSSYRFEGPYQPAGNQSLVFEIHVARSTNFDRAYTHIKSFLDTHHLNVPERKREWQGVELFPGIFMRAPRGDGGIWDDFEMNLVEGLRREDETDEDYRQRRTAGLEEAAAAVSPSDSLSDLDSVDFHSPEYRAQVAKNIERLRGMTPAARAADRALAQLFRRFQSRSDDESVIIELGDPDDYS